MICGEKDLGKELGGCVLDRIIAKRIFFLLSVKGEMVLCFP